MKLIETYSGMIWSACYEGENKDVFSKLYKKWTDSEYLTEYILSHRGFLKDNPFFNNMTEKEIIQNAGKEARSFFKSFTKFYWNEKNNEHPNFSDRFVFLNKPTEGKDDLKRKMYGHPRDVNLMISVLRLYAVKVPSSKKDEPPAYIITGGGIKLSDSMPQMKELNQEYNRIETVQNWLALNKIADKEQLINHLNNAKQSNDRVGETGDKD